MIIRIMILLLIIFIWGTILDAIVASPRSSPVLHFDDLCSRGVDVRVARAAQRCAGGHSATTAVQEGCLGQGLLDVEVFQFPAHFGLFVVWRPTCRLNAGVSYWNSAMEAWAWLKWGVWLVSWALFVLRLLRSGSWSPFTLDSRHHQAGTSLRKEWELSDAELQQIGPKPFILKQPLRGALPDVPVESQLRCWAKTASQQLNEALSVPLPKARPEVRLGGCYVDERDMRDMRWNSSFIWYFCLILYLLNLCLNEKSDNRLYKTDSNFSVFFSCFCPKNMDRFLISPRCVLCLRTILYVVGCFRFFRPFIEDFQVPLFIFYQSFTQRQNGMKFRTYKKTCKSLVLQRAFYY